MEKPVDFVVGITGASGSVYALRLIEVLRGAGHIVHAVVTESAWQVLACECGVTRADFARRVDVLYDDADIGAAIASGSFRVGAMVVVPCSMHTAGSLASGVTGSLLTRAAAMVVVSGALRRARTRSPFSASRRFFWEVLRAMAMRQPSTGS